MISSADAVPSTPMEFVNRLTEQEVTPFTPDTAFSILAERAGATYVTAGHIYATDCKKGLPGRGLDFLKKVCAAVQIPVYAIGGINEMNADACIEAGADGVCMMSGYMRI